MLYRISKITFVASVVALAAFLAGQFMADLVGQLDPQSSVLENKNSQVLGKNTQITAGEGITIDSPVKPLTNNPELILYGTKPEQTALFLENDRQLTFTVEERYELLEWDYLYKLHEGDNLLRLFTLDRQGVLLSTKDLFIKLDTVSPTCKLSYSSTEAKVGPFEIYLNCTEPVDPAPKISINQPGSADILGAKMQGQGSSWTYVYNVNKDNGKEYIDGSATVSITTNGDLAGNALGPISNRKFTIKTIDPTLTPTPTTITPTDIQVTPTSSPTPTNKVPVVDPAQEEVDTEELPDIRISKFSQRDVASKYRKGSIIKLRVEYKVTNDFMLDKNLGEYRYTGKTMSQNKYGFVVDFSKLDTEFAEQIVEVSERIELDSSTYAREIKYYSSKDNKLKLPHKDQVAIAYLVNAKQVTPFKNLELEIIPNIQKHPTLNEINNLQIDISQEVELVKEAIVEQGFLLQGTGPANTKLLIYIYSEPIVIEVTTDDEGNWEYLLTEELTPGSHTVYAALAEENAVPSDFTQILSLDITTRAQAAELQEGVDEVNFSEFTTGSISDIKKDVQDNAPMRILFYVIVGLTITSSIALLFVMLRRNKDEANLFQS